MANPLGTRRITRIFEGLRSGEPITLTVLRQGEELRLPASMGAYKAR